MSRLRNKKGQFQRDVRAQGLGLLIMCALLALMLIFQHKPRRKDGELISPIPRAQTFLDGVPVVEAKVASPSATPEPMMVKELSAYIDQAVQEFLPNYYSEAMMIMHCLAHRENGHASNIDAHGDNGKAGGPFQFWEETWTRMRKQMMAKGLATEISNRYDLKESARTTAWAIANGRALEWGPVLRKSKGSDFASCQVPSWYK